MTTVTEHERRVTVSKATDASGDGTEEFNVGGEIHSIHVGCPTSGAVITIDEIVENIGSITITGDTVLSVVVTGDMVSIHPKVAVQSPTQAADIANEYIHPHVEKAKLTIASGGNVQTTYMTMLMR